MLLQILLFFNFTFQSRKKVALLCKDGCMRVYKLTQMSLHGQLCSTLMFIRNTSITINFKWWNWQTVLYFDFFPPTLYNVPTLWWRLMLVYYLFLFLERHPTLPEDSKFSWTFLRHALAFLGLVHGFPDPAGMHKKQFYLLSNWKVLIFEHL